MFSGVLGFYKRRNPRERAMLWCIVFAVAAAWLTSQTKSCSRLDAEIADLKAKNKTAHAAVAQGPFIKKELDAILKTFDSSKALSSVALQIAVEDCARKAGLVYSLSNAATKDAGRFKINTISMSCQRGQLKNLAAFEWELLRYEPYIMLSRASFEGSPSGEVSAKYEISSFE